ncbi:MAG TPA: hypothetical protein PLO33_10425, partial [Kouleothrix sp.]|nr:hypothetical protein [Kouleothrix sp.]
GLGRVREVIAALLLQPVIYAAGLAPIIAFGLPVQALYLLFAGSFLPPVLLAAVCLLRMAPPGAARGRANISLGAALRFAGAMYGLALCGTLFTSYATLYLGALGKFADTALITIPLNIIFMPGALLNMASSTVYFPRLSHAAAQRNSGEARALFQDFASVAASAGLLVGANLLLYPRSLLYILYGARYLASAELLAILAIVAFAYPLQSVVTTTLAAQGRLRAALLYVGISTALLLVGVTLAVRYSADLRLAAAAHAVAVVPVLVWQLRTAGYPLRRLVASIGRSALALLVLGGAARLCVPDAPEHLLAAIGALSAITLLYTAWIWRWFYRAHALAEPPLGLRGN